MERKYIKLIIVCVVLVIGILFVRKAFESKTVTITEVIHSEDELYDVIIRNLAIYNNNINCRIDFSLYGLDYERITVGVMEKNLTAGSMVGTISHKFVSASGGTKKLKITVAAGNEFRAKLLERRVKVLADVARKLPDDYSKIKAVHDYLVLGNTYELQGFGAYRALCKGRCSCTGYSYAFGLLMVDLGIPVSVEYGGNHAWNRVYVNDAWYNIDCTWDDHDRISYDFFLKCDADWQGHDHGGATATESMPVYGNTADMNYDLFPDYKTRNIVLLFVALASIIGGALYLNQKNYI